MYNRKRDMTRFVWTCFLVSLWACGLLAPLRSDGALPSDITFEVRPTNGDNTFGACFSPSQAVASGGTGTDQTQSNSAVSWTNLTTSGAGSTTLTDGSATGQFTAAMQGNCIRITGGTQFAVGWYVIMSVTNSNNVVLDHTPSGAGAGSAGAGKVGGATKSFNGQATQTLNSAVVFGTTVWVKNEPWNEAVSISTACGLTATNYCKFYGYNTTRGDNPTGSNRPHNNKAGSGVPLTLGAGAWYFRDLIFSHAGATAGIQDNGAGSANIFYNVTSSDNTGNGINTNSTYQIVNCEVFNNTLAGVVLNGSNSRLVGNYIHNNAQGGVDLNASQNTELLFNIITKNTGSGIKASGANGNVTIVNNTVDGNTGASSDGINIALPFYSSFIFNNIFSNNGRYGGNTTASPASSVFIDYNLYFGNGTAARNNWTTGTHDVTTNPSYTNTTTGNYKPQSGSPVLGAGWPGGFPPAGASTSTGSIDIGAVQGTATSSSQTSAACVQ